ncbi:hypothetical protein CR513_02278, partial [Mucuna pruriens]
MDLPIRQILRKPDLVGRMTGWAVELFEFDVTYERKGHMKVQVWADFINEFSPNSRDEELSRNNREWTLLVDDSSNKKGNRAAIIIEGSGRVVEYKALLAGIRLEKELGAARSMIKSNLQLVTRQVNGEYQLRDLQLIQYLDTVKEQARMLEKFTLMHVPREKKERVDLLAKLTSTQRGGLNKIVIQEVLRQPTVQEPAVSNNVPDDPQEAKRIKREAAKYVLVAGQLYKRGFSFPPLWCLGESKVERALKEIHEGVCGSHIGGRALASKIEPRVVTEFCAQYGIMKFFTSVEHPQSNGKMETINKVILRGLGKRFEEAKGCWVEELPQVLWSYHTTLH